MEGQRTLIDMKIIGFSLLSLMISISINAQENNLGSDNPLEPFDFLIGGEWSTATTVQTFEWGVGQKSVHSKLYFIADKDTSLAGEISWFWHPGLQSIKGYGHLLSNQISFFDYSTEFTNRSTMNNSIVGYNINSMSVPIIESIEFLVDDQYRWTMYDRVVDELKPQMSIIFNRKN